MPVAPLTPLLCALVAALAPGVARSQEVGDEPEPRRKVAGIDSLRIQARVDFAAEDAAPHLLEAAFSFPDRARLELRPEGGRASQRVLRYRRGTALHGIGPGEDASTRLAGTRRALDLLQIEARLAAFLWPDAHTWTGDGARRTTRLAGLGSLEAELDDASGLPLRIVALDAGGVVRETLEVLTRRVDERGRAWPATLALSTPRGPVWRETVLAVEDRLRWADDWFTPPDRRTRAARGMDELRAVDLLEEIRRDVPFDAPPADLSAAVAAARRARAEAADGGLGLRAGVQVVVAPDLTPRAIRLVLDRSPAKLPEGWSAHGPSGAWVALLDAPSGATAAIAAGLRRAAGGTPEAASELVLVVVGPGPGETRLILPVEPGR